MLRIYDADVQTTYQIHDSPKQVLRSFAGNTNNILRLSGRSLRILWFAVCYVQETKRLQLFLYRL